LGRLFSNNHKRTLRTDLILTMTPHIIRIPDITEDDLAPMWVGTQSNLSFRGLSPRLESHSPIDPFAPRSSSQFGGRDPNTGLQLAPDGEPGNVIRPETVPATPPPGGTAPANPFRQPPPPTVKPPGSAQNKSESSPVMAASAMTPRISPQPMKLTFKPGEEKMWNVIGMDLDGLTATQIVLHYDPMALDVSEVRFGPAMNIDPKTPPVITIDREHGLVKIIPSDGNPLSFNGGGEIATLRVRGGATGETFLVMENPGFKNGRGELVASQVSGGRAKVE
jgi:hypothetical protein